MSGRAATGGGATARRPARRGPPEPVCPGPGGAGGIRTHAGAAPVSQGPPVGGPAVALRSVPLLALAALCEIGGAWLI